jgi:GxxExxY protein
VPLLDYEMTEQIIGIYYEVYAELGYGFLEKVCQRAMVIALRRAGLTVKECSPFPVWFRGHLLGDFFTDIIVNGLVLIEVKAASSLHPWDEAQVLNYLRASPLEVALILNFGPKCEFRRRILTNDRKTPRVV